MSGLATSYLPKAKREWLEKKTLDLEEQDRKKAGMTAMELSLSKSLAGAFLTINRIISCYTPFKVKLHLLPMRFLQGPSDAATAHYVRLLSTARSLELAS